MMIVSKRLPLFLILVSYSLLLMHSLSITHGNICEAGTISNNYSQNNSPDNQCLPADIQGVVDSLWEDPASLKANIARLEQYLAFNPSSPWKYQVLFELSKALFYYDNYEKAEQIVNSITAGKETGLYQKSAQNILLLIKESQIYYSWKRSLEYRQKQLKNSRQEYSQTSWINVPGKILHLINYGKEYFAYRYASRKYHDSNNKLERVVKRIPLDDTVSHFIDIAEEKYDPVPQPPLTGHTNDFRHFYGICWRGTPADNLLYAKQMGYEYVFHQDGMENDPNAAGLYFFIESPELRLPTYPHEINITKTYSREDQEYYNRMCCWRSTEPFPMNLATGWPRNEVQFTVDYDFQQQKVIDYFVSLTIAKAKEIERTNPQFRFAGLAWDEANINGEFWSLPYSRNHSKKESETKEPHAWFPGQSADNSYYESGFPGLFSIRYLLRHNEYLTYNPVLGSIYDWLVPLLDPKAQFHVPISYWTDNDSCLLHPGITHEYPKFIDGFAAFYVQMVSGVRQEVNPQAKWILEPYYVYDSWVKVVENRSDSKLLIPDMLCQESPGTDFVDYPKIFASHLVEKSNVGVTSPNFSGEFINREEAAKAGINGAWFNWYGRLGASGGEIVKLGGMPNYLNITEVPARHKLIRVIPNWDNLTDVPLEQRSWDGRVYKSPNGYASDEIYYSRHPKTRKLFVVFLKKTGKVRLYPGEKVITVKRANGFFQESDDAGEEVKVSQLSIRASDKTQLDTGYIITLHK